MDGFEKLAGGVIIAIVLIVLAIVGVGIWGFIELIQWLTAQ